MQHSEVQCTVGDVKEGEKKGKEDEKVVNNSIPREGRTLAREIKDARSKRVHLFSEMFCKYVLKAKHTSPV